ncbi:MAG: flagellar assembly protein FliW [Defluviitaleaceae bacterium]|nr:flagellar assembly protein FliW [Defluviitaleaceae bacterium]
MIITTPLFGEIEIPKEKIIEFEAGIPAFHDQTQFIVIHDEDNDNSAFCWLQSIKDPELVFPIVDILSIMPQYSPAISETDLTSIGEYEKSDFFIYNIATIPDNVEDITVNLKAPVIINAKTQKGMQCVAQNEEYLVRHKIFGDIQKRKQVQ